MSALQEAKLWLIALTGLSKDALHIYVALFVMFAVALAFRWPLRSWKPWGVVLVTALAGEAWDILDRLANAVAPHWAGHWHDVWNTMFWPSTILLLARTTGLFVRSADRPTADRAAPRSPEGRG